MTTFVGPLARVEKASGVLSVNLTLPAGAAAGDVAVAGGGCNSTALFGVQTGWTTLVGHAASADTLAPSAWIGIHTVTSTDVANGFVTLDSVPSAAGSMGGGVYQGLSSTEDFVAVISEKPNGTAANFASQTTTEVGVTFVYVCSQATVASATMTPPSTPAAFTEDGDRATGRNVSMGHLIWGSQGATGIMTVTTGVTARAIGLMVGLRSAGAPPSGPQAGMGFAA